MARFDRATAHGTVPLAMVRSSRAMTWIERVMPQPPRNADAYAARPGHLEATEPLWPHNDSGGYATPKAFFIARKFPRKFRVYRAVMSSSVTPSDGLRCMISSIRALLSSSGMTATVER